MKKIILLAGILISVAVSANKVTPKNENNKKEIVSKNKNDEEKIISKNKYTKTIESKGILRKQCATVTATCTSAYTCQDWTTQQWTDWGQQIQNNYCMIDSPYTP